MKLSDSTYAELLQGVKRDGVISSKRVAIVGGNTGLGKLIREHLESRDCLQQISVFGRPRFNITKNPGELAEELDAFNPSVVIVNAFDHDVPEAQKDFLEYVWGTFRYQRVVIVVMSSISAIGGFDSSPYGKAKHDLSELVKLYFACDRLCSIVLLQPGAVERTRFAIPGTKCLTQEELVKMFTDGLESGCKYLDSQITAVGSSVYN